MKFKAVVGALIGASALAGLLPRASAETSEIRLARQFSMGYLQLNVMEHEKLIEKHAKALGLGDVKVSWFTFNGPTAVNEALISGNIDIGSGGVPGLLTLWARSKGTPQEVRGISALSSQPFLLNSRDPAIKSITDFKDSDRIAVPAVRASVQAITLQMAAAKAYGQKDFAKLDPLTVSMTPPDATIALLKGGAQISAAFSVPPFQYQQLEDPGVHTVLNSFDVMGGSHTFTAVWAPAKFREQNPVLYKAFVAALKEATDIVNKDKRAAAALWIEDSKSKLPLDMVAKIVTSPQVRWTLIPENTMKYADFMSGVGTLKVKPATWKDYFFPEI
ncbi:MAG: ABC transporter substrate-binding protein, partial [Rhizobiales bacterium]|nr:ABC transporter substrate-binding protein [Hyphomicrobiales bacterium]